MKNHVSITGMGVISAIGRGNAFQANVMSGVCGIKPVSFGPDRRLGFDNAALVDKDLLKEAASAKPFKRLDRFAQLALVAAMDAVGQAGLESRNIDGRRIAVIVGTANSGINALEAGYEKILLEHKRPHPLSIPMIMGNAPASAIALAVGAKGPCFGTTSACVSAPHAIAMGSMLINAGLVDVAIVGGADSNDSYGFLRAWDSMGVVSPGCCKPFCTDRDGLSIGEGAGILVLERPDAGGNEIARLTGIGMSSDAGSLTSPDPAGMLACIEQSLDNAGLTPGDIGYINAHGTATAMNDAAEAQVIGQVFGPPEGQPPVSSTKSMHGHALGASGAIELITSVLAITAGTVPPTVNHTELDPACQVNLVTRPGEQTPRPVAMSNSFAFGGLNVSLIVEKQA